MKKKILCWGEIICAVILITCGCGKKIKGYNIESKDMDSKVQMTLLDDSKKGLHFAYTGNKIDSGTVAEDGTIIFYSEEEKQKQIEQLGRNNTLDIIEENGLKINYTAHPDDDLTSLLDEYDEYVYAINDNENECVATIHILMNEDAFKNRLEQIKNEYVYEGMDVYSDGMNIQGFTSEDCPYGNIEMKWIPETRRGYMIEISSPDYTFEDISCSINLKKEIDTDEEYQKMVSAL